MVAVATNARMTVHVRGIAGENAHHIIEAAFERSAVIGLLDLERSGMREVIVERVGEGVPLLGICLGMQLLATKSLEDGEWDGLDLVPGVCERLPADVKVPHIGWNTVDYPKASPLFDGVSEGSAFYFVHSYHLRPERESDIIGRAAHGVAFAAAVAHDNVFGVQFHPEKSSERGLTVLGGFSRIVRGTVHT
jgi:glutamine amidotransferase